MKTQIRLCAWSDCEAPATGDGRWCRDHLIEQLFLNSRYYPPAADIADAIIRRNVEEARIRAEAMRRARIEPPQPYPLWIGLPIVGLLSIASAVIASFVVICIVKAVCWFCIQLYRLFGVA